MQYTFPEYVDMLLTLGECHGSARAAVRRYSEQFPNRNLLNYKTFLSTERRLHERDTLKPNNSERGLVRFKHSGSGNIPEIGHYMAYCLRPDSKWEVYDDLKDTKLWCSGSETVGVFQLHPFHYRQAQDILPQDLPLRRQFCQLLLYRNAEDLRSGVFNTHNEHVWAEENPHARKVTHYQQSFKINVWAATLGNSLLGYHIIPGNLNGEL
ncbi:hypothetical protein NQ318_007669 [Aromia moschata]|uniref:DUF4817 domain-containing protein n=1 Tax=Aromia moschata TaxID=1265417 RepID=A0AAV8XLS6_9CUCU|nr:hypothetical protein NQ318_007669 [Aromia moschata]